MPALTWKVVSAYRCSDNLLESNFVCAPFARIIRDWEIAVTITPMDMGLYARDWEIAVTITPIKMTGQRGPVSCAAIYNDLSFWHDLLPTQKVKMFI